MAQTYTGSLSGIPSIRVGEKSPLDVRTVVDYLSDLTTKWDGVEGHPGIQNLYTGLVVYVKENREIYVLIGSPKNSNKIESWKKVGEFDPANYLSYYQEKLGAKIFETEDELTGIIDSPFAGMFALVIGDSDETTVEETGLYVLLNDDNTNPDNWLRIDPDYSDFVTRDELGDYIKKNDLPDFLTASDLDGYVKIDDLKGYVKPEDLKDLAKKSDLDGYVKREDAIDYLTASDLDDYLRVEELPTNVSAFINDAGYLKSEDLNGYAKIEDIPSVEPIPVQDIIDLFNQE